LASGKDGRSAEVLDHPNDVLVPIAGSRASFHPIAGVLYEHMFETVPSPTLHLIDGSACVAIESDPAPRDRSADDKSHDDVMAAPRGRDSHHDLSSALAAIEDRIEEIESEISAVAPLLHERARLLRARAVIRGEPEPRDQVHRTRISRANVFEYLARNPGSRAGEIAAGLGVGQGAVSAHLYRGKGRLFTCQGGRWYPVPAADPAARRL
jgi:hypothetical protein